MRRLTPLLILLALLALPAAATAAPAVVAPRATPVSAAGATTVEVANTTRHVLTGRATLTIAGRSAASRTVRLARRSVSRVTFRLSGAAVAALRRAGTRRAVVSLRVRRAGGRASTARRSLTLRPRAAAPAPPVPAPPVPQPPVPAPPAAGNGWLGRMGAEGPYDDLAFTLVDGRMELTKAPVVPVLCFETGGGNGSWVSMELFAAAGPWPIGTDADITAQGIAVNPLIGRGERTITYKVRGATRQDDRVSGTLGMSFFGARPDVFTGQMTIINCAGEQGFEAVPAR